MPNNSTGKKGSSSSHFFFRCLYSNNWKKTTNSTKKNKKSCSRIIFPRLLLSCREIFFSCFYFMTKKKLSFWFHFFYWVFVFFSLEIVLRNWNFRSFVLVLWIGIQLIDLFFINRYFVFFERMDFRLESYVQRRSLNVFTFQLNMVSNKLFVQLLVFI